MCVCECSDAAEAPVDDAASAAADATAAADVTAATDTAPIVCGGVRARAVAPCKQFRFHISISPARSMGGAHATNV